VYPTGWFLKAFAPALALAASALLPAAPAGAADLGVDYEYGARPVAPYGIRRHPERFEELPPAQGRVIERRTEIENCRVVVRRRVNEYGEEVLRRARICEEDEAPRYRRPGWRCRATSRTISAAGPISFRRGRSPTRRACCAEARRDRRPDAPSGEAFANQPLCSALPVSRAAFRGDGRR
jgi:hypothetical protein